jgi:hypothetical protein
MAFRKAANGLQNAMMADGRRRQSGSAKFRTRRPRQIVSMSDAQSAAHESSPGTAAVQSAAGTSMTPRMHPGMAKCLARIVTGNTNSPHAKTGAIMFATVTAHANHADASAAGTDLGRQVRQGLAGERADALIVFASSKYDHGSLLRAIQGTADPKVMVGSSSAGEFTRTTFEAGAACAVAIRSDAMEFSAGLGHGMHADRAAAARATTRSFRGMHSSKFLHRSALVMTDALAGHADDFVEQLTLATGGTYSLFGGGAGDDARFRKTHVFYGTEAIPDAAVALEILSHKPLGIGVSHGWEPASEPFRVTQAHGMQLIAVNGIPILDVLIDHARQTGQEFDRLAPLPFFLHNVLGIVTGSGYRLRVPLAILEDGSLHCAAEIPLYATIHIMKPQRLSALEATKKALGHLEGNAPGLALFFDCVATRLRMGDGFGFELDAIGEALGQTAFAGCNTYGQISRAPGQFNGFHNCTAVVCILPQ